MKRNRCSPPVFVALMIVLSWLCFFTVAIAGSKEPPIATKGSVIKIDVPGNRARLCPNAWYCEECELLRLPTNTKLVVKSVLRVRYTPSAPWDVIWYKVTYKGKEGWVSEFNTDKAPKEPRYR